MSSDDAVGPRQALEFLELKEECEELQDKLNKVGRDRGVLLLMEKLIDVRRKAEAAVLDKLEQRLGKPEEA